MQLHPNLLALIRRKISTFRRQDILEAIRLSESFPCPANEPGDVFSQVIHDIALHAEALGDWRLCADLYEKALRYTVVTARIRAGNWYRYGLCSERMGDYREAVAAYLRVTQEPNAWPYVTALTRWRLAGLLVAAEDFSGAAEQLGALLELLPHPEIPQAAVEIELARCEFRLGNRVDARRRLEALIEGDIRGSLAVDALCLLAEVCMVMGDHCCESACYEKIIHHEAADLHTRMGASHRLSHMRMNR
jgi:tetratricopeptide (TPR) repeat protein